MAERDRSTDDSPSSAVSGSFPTAAAEVAQALPERAAAEQQTRGARPSKNSTNVSLARARKLVHELKVQQAELELQNEELRHAQLELSASRARYFDLYEHAPVGYVTLSSEGVVTEANLTAAALLEVASGALVDQLWTRFIAPADHDLYLRHSRRLVRSGQPQACELRLLKTSGQSFWGRLEARVSHAPGGTPAARTVLSDISERKRSEQTLELSKARHRASFENSRDALMTLAPPSWHFTSANAAALRMFGACDEAEFIERAPSFVSPERQPSGRLSQEQSLVMIETAMLNGSHSFDWTHRRASGEQFRATVLLARMELDGTELLEATVRDETELQKQRSEVAQTERLASMGMLAASVGHEINNPLAYVLSNVESLTKTLTTVAGAAEIDRAALIAAGKAARDALDGARRITRISRVLSTFSRVDALDLGKVDLGHVIECAVTIAFNETRIRSKVIQDLAPVPAVWACEGKLSQVFVNLLINASHAMDEGSSERQCITIRTWSEGDQVLAEVSDTGQGIQPENIDRVFEPFFSTKSSGMGSGLGLSICRKIVAEFGGSIEIASVLGEGTRVLVKLPPCSDTTADEEAPPLLTVAEPRALRGRILLVDDEGPLRRAIARLLLDHEVHSAGSGKEAQVILERDEKFDVILCDLMMPEVTGIELHRWLVKRNPVLAKRMIFLTGGAFGPVDAGYLNEFGSVKLEKPFENETLLSTVAAGDPRFTSLTCSSLASTCSVGLGADAPTSEQLCAAHGAEYQQRDQRD